MNFIRKSLSHTKTLLYRRPKDELSRFLRWGPGAYFYLDTWKREMEEAVKFLPSVDTVKGGHSTETTPLAVWFLTGKDFWYQTAFCAWTLSNHSSRALILNLVSDGSLSRTHEDSLRRLFPEGITVHKEEIRDKIENLLPIDQFPMLRQRWEDYVNIRKLTDVHLGSVGTKLVLDSDMLFFRRPDALLDWWDDCNALKDEAKVQEVINSAESTQLRFRPLLMTDCEESYGYSRSLMESLVSAPIPSLLNVGICGLRSEDLNWEEIEYWCQELYNKEGTSYYLEQALVAMIAARETPEVMPKDQYITYPKKAQVMDGEGILQHYVSDSKPWYFGNAWKQVLEK